MGELAVPDPAERLTGDLVRPVQLVEGDVVQDTAPAQQLSPDAAAILGQVLGTVPDVQARIVSVPGGAVRDVGGHNIDGHIIGSVQDESVDEPPAIEKGPKE